MAAQNQIAGPTAGGNPWDFYVSGPGKGLPDPYRDYQSGVPVASAATGAMKDWTSKLQNLWNTSNQGRDLFSRYDVSLSDPKIWNEMRAGSQMMADLNRPRILDWAKKLSNVNRPRGGFGNVGGMGSFANMLRGLSAGTAEGSQDKLQGLLSQIVANKATAGQRALGGFTGLLGGVGAGLGLYGQAAGRQVDALHKMNLLQQAERNRMQDIYMQGQEGESAWEEDLRRKMAYLQYKTALQQQMDMESAAQTFQQFATGGGGNLFGNRLTDTGRAQQMMDRLTLDAARQKLGYATPVTRTQDMTKILGKQSTR